MQGKIIRGIAGFYYVYVKEKGIVECKAKGLFRKKKIKPLVGDDVEITMLQEEPLTGNITEIYPRKNELIRPAVANVDQAVVIFAASYPEPNLNLLDRFILMMQMQHVPTLICINKLDSVSEQELNTIRNHYVHSECMVLVTSTITKEGMDDFTSQLKGKTTVLAGPSGVGKSSIMNCILPEANMETGDISAKIKRGKHTTRYSELFFVSDETFVMDTPGFTSLELPRIEKENLREYYPEFTQYQDECRFLGCVHINEPSCGVKKALEEGKISTSRYENYKLFYEELKNMKSY